MRTCTPLTTLELHFDLLLLNVVSLCLVSDGYSVFVVACDGRSGTFSQVPTIFQELFTPCRSFLPTTVLLLRGHCCIVLLSVQTMVPIATGLQ